MRFIARRGELAAERSISWSPRSLPECGSSKEGRIGDLLTNKFSDQFSFGGAFKLARGKEGGEFSAAIEEEALFCFDDFREGIPGKERRTACTFELDAVGGENMRGRFRAGEGASELPCLVEGMQQEPEGNGSFDVGAADQSNPGDLETCVGRGACFECDESEQRTEDETDRKQINVHELAPTGIERSVAEVDDV